MFSHLVLSAYLASPSRAVLPCYFLQDGIHILNIGKTWEKLVLAARIIVAIENPQVRCGCSTAVCD